MASTLSEQIYDKLLQTIILDNYKPNDKLPSENELSKLYEVSRNTIRAAINKLNALGFTETKHGGGTYIKSIGREICLNYFIPTLLMESDDLLEIMEFRKGIEVEAVKLAARNANEENLKHLKEVLERSQDASGNMNEFAFENTNFHTAIAKASNNKMFAKLMEIIRSLIMTKMQKFLVIQGEDIDSNFYHSMIFQCIAHKKPEEAAFFMDKHMTLVIDRVKKYIEDGNSL